MMIFHIIAAVLYSCSAARDIIFPPVSGFATQQLLGHGGEVDVTAGPAFAGLTTYANLPYVHCLAGEGQQVDKFDVAILGAPFDTGVTARPGARFGPGGIRQGSRRIDPDAAWDVYTGSTHVILNTRGEVQRMQLPYIVSGAEIIVVIVNGEDADPVPYNEGKNVFYDFGFKIVDCGDAPLTFLDNTIALKQLYASHRIISGRASNSSDYPIPRIVTLGGDHTTTLSALRSVCSRWGTVSVIHFDSHIDTWDPKVLGGGVSHYAGVNHGTFLHIAHEEGLIHNTSIHAGIRAPVVRPKGDFRNDLRCGFEMVKARDIDRIGVSGVIKKLKERVAGSKVYVSVDIDVLDPAFAPATGTAEVGGWTTRELLSILDGLAGLDVVGADVVEVAPIYDNPGETTVLAAAEVVQSLLRIMVVQPVKN